MSTTALLRWLLLPVAAVAVFIACFFLSLIGNTWVESLCPSDQMVSDICFSPLMQWYDQAAEIFFPTLAGVLIILCSYWIAPTQRWSATAMVYLIGISVALIFAIMSQLWITFLVTITSAGLILALLLLHARRQTQPPTRRYP